MAKESLECTFSDNINAAEKRAELRETELNALVDSLQTKNGLFNCCNDCLQEALYLGILLWPVSKSAYQYSLFIRMNCCSIYILDYL